MSATDQHQTVSAEAGPDADLSSPASEDAGKDSSAWIIFLFFAIGFVGSILIGWFVFPNWLYSTKVQPIDFNHSLHMEMVDDGCNSCHFFREDGSFAGVPTLAQCADCHQDVQGSDPNEEVFVNEYVLKEKEVPWYIYSKQPDCVFYSHSAHVQGAGMSCESCHGDIGNSEHLRPYQENRLTGYSRDIWGYSISRLGASKYVPSMKMNDCAKCHAKETGYKGYCFQCHK